jgi:hypothetical protein
VLVALVLAVVHLLMIRVAVLPGVTVPVALPVVALMVAALAVLIRVMLRSEHRRFRSSPFPRPVTAPAWT